MDRAARMTVCRRVCADAFFLLFFLPPVCFVFHRHCVHAVCIQRFSAMRARLEKRWRWVFGCLGVGLMCRWVVGSKCGSFVSEGGVGPWRQGHAGTQNLCCTRFGGPPEI